DSTSSSSDDEKFQRRRSTNRNRCLPMNLVKEDLLGIHKDRMKIGASLADVDPMQIDKTVRFDSIGGLSRHIAALKEMVVFPLLYPEVFERFKIQPPRGCLFYGPPGTGKTLVARALANECSQGERKVSFFMRKGADCLSKWVGESERQLRLLFDQAYQMRPSIIFFDEIDGLAPVRSSRQDQIHSSIVSTLLALMDGLDSRGEVVVIGATNRLDSIDPALRRPGRFDREFLFGLPDREARKDILKIHTRQWTPQPSDAFLEELADKCVGYCGADIKAVCSEAALCALRRRYPQIYSSSQKLVLDVNNIAIGNRDFMSAMAKMVPAAQRAVVSPAKALIPAIRPLLSAALQDILHIVSRLFPHAEQGLKRKRDQGGVPLLFSLSFLHGQSVLSQPTSFRPRLLLEGRPGSGQSSHLAPALLHALEKFTVYTLDMAVLFGASATAPEETCAQLFVEAKRTSPSILYIPHIGQWWETVGPALRATFLSLLHSIPAFAPILLLATCSLPYERLSAEVQELFRVEYGEVFHVRVPTSRERRDFFEDLILNQAAKAPPSKKKAVLRALEVLPVAPPPPPRQLTEKEAQRLEEQEEDTLRELRLFLRDVTNRLSQDKRFKAFTKPVPDYAEVIKQPMDLSTVLSRIDLHHYGTVKEFLHDVDLIWQNALEYNPDRDPSDRQIRHRACALKDTVHAIITDELDEDFEKICEEIKESRRKRGELSPPLSPSHIPTVKKKRRKSRKSRWCNGIISKKKSTSSPHVKDDAHPTGSEEDEEDGEDEEDAGKGEAATHGEGAGGEEEQMEVAIESGLMATQDVSLGCDSKERDGQEEEKEERSQVAEEVMLCGDGEASSNGPVLSDENTKLSAEGEEQNSGGTTARANMDSNTATGRDGQGQTSTTESNENHSQKPSDCRVETPAGHSQTEERCADMEAEENQTAPQGDGRNNTETTSEEAEQNGHEEPMEVEETENRQTSSNPPGADKVEEDTVTKLKCSPLWLLSLSSPLQELLDRLVAKTDNYEVHQLEKLYALLCQSIYRHRRDYNKAALIQEMEQEIEDFY
uniref:ATPase family AAA domain-containing protein 2 n=1 Tax=Myripristis murdjan TaxID=586833 RepID=A0A667YYY7_9TELE